VPLRLLLFALSLSLSYLNYRGLHIVGNGAIASTVYIIVPFLVLGALAIPHVQPSNWLVQDWGAVQWGPFINVMFWCAAVQSRCSDGWLPQAAF